MKLLLDLGNTRLKWAALDRGMHIAQGAVAWNDDVESALAAAWGSLDGVAHIYGASVVDAAKEARVEAMAKAIRARSVVWLRTPAEACGVRSAYVEPERLGVDRFLAMVSAYHNGDAPCVLVGVGTALTLDALDGEGRHLGGLIAPGPQLMQQSLWGATARLHPEPGRVLDVADNTADAIASGCWQAAVALIERFVARMSPRLGGAPRVILGGGDAAQLQPLLALPTQLTEDSVLRGLAVWAEAHSTTMPPL
ncbi:type III pantothenate kinase [Dyella sp. GSA-30]|uniref:type III pantothenate kinase n=1 Tax=Dyella sp. GSA-30 TaxID=2994496 RepID=UPI002490A334|nr:type III pantothenate kinase [Dyella sp. GSA-30]BDU20138.1 type III pantothenate kinase [Dyella sp. GSA-30]